MQPYILTSPRYTIIRYLGEMVFSNIFSCLSKQGKTRLAVGKVTFLIFQDFEWSVFRSKLYQRTELFKICALKLKGNYCYTLKRSTPFSILQDKQYRITTCFKTCGTNSCFFPKGLKNYQKASLSG